MRQSVLMVLMVGLLMFGISCTQENQRSTSTAVPGQEGRASQWRPDTINQKILAGDIGKADFLNAAVVKEFLRDACHEYYRLHQRLPGRVEDLVALGFLPYSRTDHHGSPIPWVSGTEQAASATQLTVEMGDPIRLWIPSQDPGNNEFPMTLKHAEILSLAGNHEPGSPLAPQPIAQLRAQLAPHAAEVGGDFPEGKKSPRAGNVYYINSDQPNEARLRLAEHGIRSLAGLYVMRHGVLPPDWATALRELGYTVSTYTPEVSPELPAADQMALWVGVDSSGLLLKIVSKPTIDAITTAYLRWHLNMQQGGVERVEVLLEPPGVPHSAFTPMLQTFVQTDHVEGLRASPTDAEQSRNQSGA